MNDVELKNYIGAMLRDPSLAQEVIDAIPTAKLLFKVYEAGLQGKPFPIWFLGNEVSLEQEINSRWHTFIGCITILVAGVKISPLAQLMQRIVTVFKEVGYFYRGQDFLV